MGALDASTGLLRAIDLVVFDKDGTLIDFHSMWGGWARELAGRLEAGAGRSLAADYLAAIGFDPGTGRVEPRGALATLPGEEFRRLTKRVLREAGVDDAERVVEAAWFAPDPVTDARPLADLRSVFQAVRAGSRRRVAVATTDDREPTLATLAALGVDRLVDLVLAADDGLPPKPAPDQVLAACAALGVPAARTAVIGDSPVDLEMGRAAGVGLRVGVLSGIASREELAPLAEVVLGSVEELGAGA